MTPSIFAGFTPTAAEVALRRADRKPPFFWPVPVWGRLPEKCPEYGVCGFIEATALSRNSFACGYLTTAHIDMNYQSQQAGRLYVIASKIALWVLEVSPFHVFSGRSIWDDSFYAWETMDDHNRDFFLSLDWSPAIPMTPLEVLANVA